MFIIIIIFTKGCVMPKHNTRTSLAYSSSFSSISACMYVYASYIQWHVFAAYININMAE